MSLIMFSRLVMTRLIFSRADLLPGVTTGGSVEVPISVVYAI
jgi:hypothetical protein